MTQYPAAHTPPPGEEHWHGLRDHLRVTARCAEEFARVLGLPALAHAAGILHDIGKNSPAFQQYLQDAFQAESTNNASFRSRSIDHKTAGAIAGSELCPALAFAILGHHGGLPGQAALANQLQNAGKIPDIRQAITDGKQLLGDDWPIASLMAEAEHLAATPLQADLLMRLLYSCLVDADALDTESHFTPQEETKRAVDIQLDDLLTDFLTNQKTLLSKANDTPVNAVRKSVYQDCLRAAALPLGVFTLTVPTGGGKTRSSLAFALQHALRHGQERVIYAVPYTSIIEQTAEVFRGIFSHPQAVLEHHSSVREAEDDYDADGKDLALWQRLAAENWDAPLIVTTTVQCFESLFAARPAKCRKVHRLARSVLILDEAQALPPPLLAPIIDALHTLVTRYGTTVVLCTATQPALSAETGFLRGFTNVREIVAEPARHFMALERVTYAIKSQPWSWEQVSAEMRRRDQVLTVLNTRKDALALLEALQDPDALHLSTLLCPAHRRAILAEIRRRLNEELPCRVVSTQVVEAGVDLDFPCVLRAVGPLDRIVQAAGRCNREGKHERGEVIIFTPETLAMPSGAYRTAFEHAAQFLRDPRLDLQKPDLFPAYFRAVFADIQLDSSGIQALRARLDFPEVAARFRMIPDETVSVLVAYEQARMNTLIDRLRAKGHANRQDWREAQQMSVALRKRDFDKYLRAGNVIEVLPGVGIYRWLGSYHPVFGITAVSWDPADLMVSRDQ